MHDAVLLLRNTHLSATALRPDPEDGLYRGARFVWAGILGEVVCDGRTFLTPWNPAPGPTSHDGNALGTAGEFRLPLGYDDARPGEGFVKVGVGVLAREGDGPYRFSHPYAVLDHGAWTVEADASAARFVQTLDGRYRLAVDIALDADRPGFSIGYALTNLGDAPIVTDHYDHHFFNIDGGKIGPETELSFPFAAVAQDDFGHGARIENGVLRLPAPLAPGTWIGASVDGWGTSAADNAATFTDRRTGASIAFVGDTPLSGYYVWGMENCLCPEPYIAVRVAPGATMRWRETFTLYSV